MQLAAVRDFDVDATCITSIVHGADAYAHIRSFSFPCRAKCELLTCTGRPTSHAARTSYIVGRSRPAFDVCREQSRIHEAAGCRNGAKFPEDVVEVRVNASYGH